MAELRGDTVEQLESILSTIQDNIRSLTENVGEVQEVLRHLRPTQAQEVLPDDMVPQAQDLLLEDMAALEITPLLSVAAISAINNSSTSGGPLNPENLKKFLDDSFNKKQVLPIVRQYTPQVEDLIQQLIYVKNENNASYDRYMTEHRRNMEQRRLDTNLNKRIDTMVDNLRRELRREAEA